MRPSILIACALLATPALAQNGPRDIQFTSIDFEQNIIEMQNVGPIDIALDGWRFCTHNGNSFAVYTSPSGLNGVVMEAGTSLFVHLDNDAPAGDPDRLNQSSLGNFASPFGVNTFAMQMFRPSAGGTVQFGNSSLITDHIQWSRPGDPVNNAIFRSDQAVATGLWTAELAFIDRTGAARIDLTDAGDGLLHGPANYTVGLPGTPAVETVRLGTPANPDAFRPGVTSGPVLGQVWDPVVDHASFTPAALVDFLVLTGAPANLPMPLGGTLLCDLSTPLLRIELAPAVGTPFALPVPVNPAFEGATFCAQGGSLDGAAQVQLANALDITLGTN